MPPRVYRCPDEIRADISDIRERIRGVNELFNIRELIAEIINEGAEGDVRKLAIAAGELADHAEEALAELRMLNADLDELRAELIETLGELGE